MRPSESLFLKTVLYLTLGAIVPLSGCAYLQKTLKGSKSKPAPKQTSKPAAPKSRAKPADPQAQQRAYDLGMRYYAEENYAEAKKAWQQSLQYGPNTPLAGKARDNIKKADQVLQTLKEMENK